MLNRRILRIKAFKTIYTYAENPSMELREAEEQFATSCEAVRDLYLFMLAVIPAVTAEARQRIADAMAKFNPTEEEKNPDMKFATNSLSTILSEDPDFQKLLAKKKLSWEQFDVFIRNLYDSMRSKDWFKEYMAAPGSSLAGEVEMFTHMCEEEFVESEELAAILEDLNIWWNDDLAYALTWCCNTMKDMVKTGRWEFPPLYQSDVLLKQGKPADSDKTFAQKLLRAAFTGYGKYEEMVAMSVPKWDKERIYAIDVALIAMGLAEAVTFPEIPVKVTINEYVEISKYYSTPKSRSFVNGLLDRLIQSLAADGKIVKSGKGLL